ncbi:MAG TPA: hypothetical protein VGN82_14370 [Bosea sp. (in: a-proteobacteria)]|jgi:hypothetical protein|uniref:hypothetical protein n=1 Tax=Bosea sp. (in: a-proteobacteria) TaxID=1871050 RepID=UPI002E1686EC|nr:hypothetical protein [Bosea sp. (in: a-proteobacteria)]
MSEETLHTAARRVMRNLRIDETKGGGMLSIETLHSMSILDIQIEKENARQKLIRDREADAR